MSKTKGGKLRARKPCRPFMVRSSIGNPRRTTMRQDPSFKSLLRNSICEIARRSREATNAPRQARRARLRKIDNFLPSRRRTGIVFQKVDFARLTLPVGVTRPGLWRQKRKMARKWRRNWLKSLKTDSEMASRRLAIVRDPAPSHLGETYPRRSGGVASLTSASSASSAPIAVCALEPRRRNDTVFSLASLRPRATRTGTFANECSRTL